jgi:NitT/TauT family transport system substrate-binding protein
VLISTMDFLRPARRALRPVLWFAPFLLFCALPGCRHQPTPANGLIPVSFQTDWYPQPEHGGFYEALLKGYYRQEGLDVTILPGGPYNSVEQQVSTGAAQFGMGSSDHILEADSQGQTLVAVGATMQSDPQGIMMHASSPVSSFPDLEGRTIAVKPGSTWFEYLVHRYNLKNAREIPATYSIANFLQDPNYIQQIFVTSEPFFARKAGAQVRTLLISDTGYSPYRVFFTSRSYIAQHPDIVAKFVRASIHGWRDYMQDPSLVDAELLKRNPAQQPEQMQFTWHALKDGHFVDGGDPARIGQMTSARWIEMYGQLSGLGLIPHPIDPATAYTLQFVPSK